MLKKCGRMMLTVPLIVFTLIISFAAADSEGTIEPNITWILSDSGVLTISGNGAMKNFQSGDYSPWNGSEHVRSVVIENGVTTIGDDAFAWCTNLETVTLPEGLIRIGQGAFTYCTKLQTIELPNSLEEIGWSCFCGTDLTTIRLPKNVKNVHASAFDCMEKLSEINVSSDNKYYMAENGVLYSKDGKTLLKYPAGKAEKTFSIPSCVVSIGDNAFRLSKLEEVSIPESVKSIGEDTFWECYQMESLVIPGNVESIGTYAFNSCQGLKQITLNEGIKTIGGGAFCGCSSLQTIRIPASVTKYGEDWQPALGSNYEMEEIQVDSGNQYYSAMDGVLFNQDKTCLIFYPEGKREQTYSVPAGVASIESYAFRGISYLKELHIPLSLTRIGGAAFLANDGLTDVYYAGSRSQWDKILVEEANDALFDAQMHFNDMIINLTLPANMDRIESEAFAGLKEGMAIYIPQGVNYIADDAFGTVKDLTICSRKDSEAERYANEKGYFFIEK